MPIASSPPIWCQFVRATLGHGKRHSARAMQWLANVLLVGWAGASLAQQASELTPVQLTPSAWYVQGLTSLGTPANQNFISNAAFIVTAQGVVVIDALGSPALAQQLVAAIRKITPQPITHLIVTHYHADHVYGLQVFKALGARILAHHAARSYLNSDTARLRLLASRQELSPWIDANTELVEADEWLEAEQELDLGGVRLQIKHVGPSHTPEDLVVYLPQQRLLFAGDLVFRARIPFVGQADSRRWIAALDGLLAMDTRLIVPGHGPVSESAREDMQLTRDYLSYMRSAMGQAAKNMDPFEEAYAATDWSRFEALPLFRLANRMNAYNTYLLLEQEN